ncbi:tRNA (adenosine(37)-N6)-threonylcarbamoyltransferase complex ATPase subunit type 1 TsaE [Ferruginibacter sp.]
MEVIFKLEDIQQAAAEFIKHAPGAKVFAFYAPMGAGKTTFIQALCRALGVKDNTSSPTFSIINQYKAGNDIIYHMDLYRVRDENEAINAGVEDCLYSGSICFVEWPEKAPGILPDNTLQVSITIIDSHTRKLSTL